MAASLEMPWGPQGSVSTPRGAACKADSAPHLPTELMPLIDHDSAFLCLILIALNQK